MSYKKGELINEFIKAYSPRPNKNENKPVKKLNILDREAFTNEEFNKMSDVEKQVYNLPVFRDLNANFGIKIK